MAFGNLFDSTVNGNPAPAQPNPYAAVGPGVPGSVGSTGGPGKGGGIFGIGDENVQDQLAASGYSPYAITAAPNVSSLFQTDQAPEQQFRAGEVGLMGQLQTAAAGQGPSAAQSTLRTGTDQNIATQMALAATGRGNPGTMAAVTNAGVTAGQQAANAAAALRAQEIASAQGELGGVAGAGAAGDLGEQQLRASQGAGLAGTENSNWQFGQGMNASQQNALNAIIAQAVAGANASQQALLPAAIGAAGGAASAGLTGGLSALIPKPMAAPAAHGTIADHPQVRLIGEAGPEAVVPIDQHGRPDMSRATDPKLHWILEHHGYDWAGSKEAGMPHALPHQGTVAGNGNADHGLLSQIVALRQDIQRLAGRGA